MYRSVNPFDDTILAEFPTASDAEIDDALDRADAGFHAWRATPVAERCAVLSTAAELVRKSRDELARLSTLEMGRLYGESLYEVDLAAGILDYYATHTPAMLEPRAVPSPLGDAVVLAQPTGIVFAIEPWNAPFYQVFRPLAPQLGLGNSLILKHAPGVPQCALAIESLLREAGLPDGVFVNVFADHRQAERIIADPRVQGVTLTGSDRAGAAVAATAGRNLTKSVLELGGSDPMIVLEDADLDLTVACARSRIVQSGQVCCSAKRIIVVDAVYDEFLGRYLESLGALSPGDPLDRGTTLAPLSSKAAAAGVRAQISEAVAAGASATEVGPPVPLGGAFVQPTVLTGVSSANPVFHQEIFGPVPIVFRVADEADAIALANDTPYGLGGSVYGRDTERAADVARRIDTGMVWINSPTLTSAELPFGGIKRSGYGTELGEAGLLEFANQKLIVTVRPSDP